MCLFLHRFKFLLSFSSVRQIFFILLYKTSSMDTMSNGDIGECRNLSAMIDFKAFLYSKASLTHLC